MKITIENRTITTKDNTRPNVVPHVTDFFEVRHFLMLASRETDTPKGSSRRPVQGNGRRETFTAPANLVDEAIYWFISAPALVYLIYLIFGL